MVMEAPASPATPHYMETMAWPWWATLLQGLFGVLIGLLLLFVPGTTMLVIVQFLAWWWFFGGIVNLVMMFVDHTMWGWKLASGVLGVLAGLYAINNPLWSALLVPAVYVIILGINGLILGVIDIIKAFQGAGWGIGILGVLSLLFGIILLANPIIGALYVPFVLGALGVIFGAVAIYMSFQFKKTQEA